MGRDKALLPFAGATLLAHQVELLRASGACDEVLVSGDRPGWPSVPDLRPGCGPLGALEAVVARLPGRRLLVVPVDMPGLRPDDLRMLANAGDAPLVHFADLMLPLRLRADAAAATAIAQLLEASGEPGGRGASLHALATALAALALPRPPGDDARWRNLNTPLDYEGARP